MLEEKSESEDIYEMPLLDNVRELISREKELMGLQVAEKAEEAAAWEARARALEAQLADGAGEGGGLTEGMWGEGEPGPPDWVTLQRCTPVELGEAFPGGAVQLKGAGLGRHGAGEVARRLRRLPGLRALGLADNDLEDDAAEQVETFLGLPGLASLDLSHNRLGAACGAALCRGLRSLGSLQVLRLEGNLDLSACPNFGRALAGALGRARRQGGAKRLWSLDVTLRDSRYEGCGKYFQAVFEGCPCQGHSKTAPKPKCEFCRRQWNPLPPDDGAPPMNAHRFLATLNSEDGAFPGLRHLGLRHAWLSPRTARALARRLTGAPGLTSLDLRDAFLGSAGAQELAATLNSPGQCLTSLNLTRNGIACAGAAALAEAIALACPGTLTRLNLTLNDVGAAGARALADALPSAARAGGGVLARLDVGHNPVPRAAAERLAAAALGARVRLGGIEDLDVRVELMAPPRWPRGGGGHPLPFQVVPEEVQQLCVAVGGGDGYQQMVSLTVDSTSLEGEKNKNKAAGRGRAPAAAAAVPGGREGGAEEEEGQGQRFVRARFLAQRATPDAAAGHFRWRFTRRRALQTAVLAEGVGSAGRALPARGLPPKYRGYRRCEAVLSGLRAGDGLQLWLAAADRRGRALPPSLLPEAGSLKAAQLELYAHDGRSHGLLYSDLAAGAAALRREPVGAGWARAPAAAEERRFLEESFLDTEGEGGGRGASEGGRRRRRWGAWRCLHRVQCAPGPAGPGDALRLTFSLALADDDAGHGAGGAGHRWGSPPGPGPAYTWAVVGSRPCQSCWVVESGVVATAAVASGALEAAAAAGRGEGEGWWRHLTALSSESLAGDTLSIWGRVSCADGGEEWAEARRAPPLGAAAAAAAASEGVGLALVLRDLRVYSTGVQGTEGGGVGMYLGDAEDFAFEKKEQAVQRRLRGGEGGAGGEGKLFLDYFDEENEEEEEDWEGGGAVPLNFADPFPMNLAAAGVVGWTL